MHRLSTLSLSAALVLAAGCVDDKTTGGGGDAGPGFDSGRDSGGRDSGGGCEGCLSAFGSCEPGDIPASCGARGMSCRACASGEECAEGECMAPPGCDPATCDGCCMGDSCVGGTAEDACGIDGVECTACRAPATCVAGQCEAPCAESCDGCCEADGTCVDMASIDARACGADGAMCAACAGSEECVGGECISRSCATSCAGCCMGDTCVDPTTDSACGAAGEACMDCGGGTCGAGGVCSLDPDSRWDVVAVDGTLPDRNAGGSSWDSFGGLPDPFVELWAGSGASEITASSTSVDNTVFPAWIETVLSDVPASALLSRFEAEVRDSDFDADDSFGVCTIALDESYLPSTFTATCPADTAAGRAGWMVRFRIVAHTP
jgi:hypothetical protein